MKGAMRIAIRGLVQDGNYVTVRLAFPEEGEKCFELNAVSRLNLAAAILGINTAIPFKIVDERVNDDTEEWVIRFELHPK
jgi:hypothetical protein